MSDCTGRPVRYTIASPPSGLGGVDLGGGVVLAPQHHRYIHLCEEHAAALEAEYDARLMDIEPWVHPSDRAAFTCKGLDSDWRSYDLAFQSVGGGK